MFGLMRMFALYYYATIITLCAVKCSGIASINAVTSEKNKERNSAENCFSSFQGYDNIFLRGVKEEFFVTYNETSFEDCMKICCEKEKFNCRSFSYFVPLRVCWVMNITDGHHSASLEFAAQWKHYRVKGFKETTLIIPAISTVISTTLNTTFDDYTTSEQDYTSTTAANARSIAKESLTTNSDVTGARTLEVSETTLLKDDVIKYTITRKENVPSNLSLSVRILSEVKVATTDQITTRKDLGLNTKKPLFTSSMISDCQRVCMNGGICDVTSNKEEGKSFSKNKNLCSCKSGYTGSYCEKQSYKAGGVPPYITAIAVLGGLILILLTTLLVLYLLYRKRTGKYRVKEERERWKKKREGEEESANQ